ncbi:glycosyltransferase [Streptomyces parvus]|uniref:glycosyltransferase n=2 Tax=Actinomycetes TaxID=1760 RepID=UPI0036E84A14
MTKAPGDHPGSGERLDEAVAACDRAAVAGLLARADVALATCPIESFGLAVLEALACGTPVVTADRGAAHELLAPGAGAVVAPRAAGFADGVEEVLSLPAAARRAAARARAERYPWTTTIAGMLDVLTAGTAAPGAPAPGTVRPGSARTRSVR